MNKLVSITALICFLTVSAPAFAISQASSKDAKPVTNQLSTPLHGYRPVSLRVVHVQRLVIVVRGYAIPSITNVLGDDLTLSVRIDRAAAICWGKCFSRQPPCAQGDAAGNLPSAKFCLTDRSRAMRRNPISHIVCGRWSDDSWRDYPSIG